MEQSTLFDDIAPPSVDYPPEWPFHGTASGDRYGCTCGRYQDAGRASRQSSAARAGKPRACRRCGASYVYVPHSGNGTKFCSTCKLAAYAEAARRVHGPQESAPCDGCGLPTPFVKTHAWHLCPTCWPKVPKVLVAALRRHRASAEFVLRVAARPSCWACGIDLLAKIRNTSGGLRYQFALDHDHTCCPSGTSCGQCLRGLLCNSCNTALGYLRDSPERARALADYIASVPASGGAG